MANSRIDAACKAGSECCRVGLRSAHTACAYRLRMSHAAARRCCDSAHKVCRMHMQVDARGAGRRSNYLPGIRHNHAFCALCIHNVRAHGEVSVSLLDTEPNPRLEPLTILIHQRHQCDWELLATEHRTVVRTNPLRHTQHAFRRSLSLLPADVRTQPTPDRARLDGECSAPQ